MTDDIKQAVRDEPRRRMDEAPNKLATDRHAIAATSASALNLKEEEGGQSNKWLRSRLDEGAEVEEGTEVL